MAAGPSIAVSSTGARAVRRWAWRLVRVVALSYVLIVIGVVAFASRLIFPAPQTDTARLADGARELTLTAADGVAVHAIAFDPPAPDAAIVVQFHGNGEIVGGDQWIGTDLAKRGLGTVLVEYRGYGRSSGKRPTEAGIYADASAVLDHLRASRVADSRVVLWGFSLGTGVAAEMAVRGYGSRLVLQAPFTSIPDMAMLAYPYLPARWLTPVALDTLAKAPRIHIPTLVLHGDADSVIPFAFGERVAKAIPGAMFVPIAHGEHQYEPTGPLLDRIVAFARS